MKYRTIFALVLLVLIWIFISIKFIGFNKTNTVKVNTTSSEFVSPTPTSEEIRISTESANPVSESSSSSYFMINPTVSVLRY